MHFEFKKSLRTFCTNINQHIFFFILLNYQEIDSPTIYLKIIIPITWFFYLVCLMSVTRFLAKIHANSAMAPMVYQFIVSFFFSWLPFWFVHYC